MATHQGAEHHHRAAEHHEHAARHHREAAKHHEGGEHEKAGESEIVSPKCKPKDVAREADGSSEPWEQDASGKPAQPQDRPPARPHMTVTHKPDPSPHELHEKMDGK